MRIPYILLEYRTLNTNSNILDDCRVRGERKIPWKKGLKNRSTIKGDRP